MRLLTERKKDMRAIEVRNLSKSFGSLRAVDDVSFQIEQGSFFALLGENGAGKSTLIQMITGALLPDSGKVFISGIDSWENFALAKKEIGVVFQESVLDQQLSVRQNLELRSSMYGLRETERKETLHWLKNEFLLESIWNQKVRTLSGGQRRRTDIARALLHRPSVLILDEPTTGLDPKTRSLIWTLLLQLRQKQHLTLVVTTHYLEEVQDADSVIILDEGKVKARGSVLQLKQKYAKDKLTVYQTLDNSFLGTLPYSSSAQSGKTTLWLDNAAQARDLILTYPGYFEDFELSKGSMEDVFLQITGKELHETI